MTICERPGRRFIVGLSAFAFCAVGLFGIAASYGAADDDKATAESLAAMLRAGRTVISLHQATINNPDIGDKGLTGRSVLAEAMGVYQKAMGIDPTSLDPASRQGRLLRAQMDAIAEAVDANQDTLNKKGVGFKGFIPSTFGRLVNEGFNKRAIGDAEVKVTAPPDLIRNRKATPNSWETDVIRTRLQAETGRRDNRIRMSRPPRAAKRSVLRSPNITRRPALPVTVARKGKWTSPGIPRKGAKRAILAA